MNGEIPMLQTDGFTAAKDNAGHTDATHAAHEGTMPENRDKSERHASVMLAQMTAVAVICLFIFAMKLIDSPASNSMLGSIKTAVTYTVDVETIAGKLKFINAENVLSVFGSGFSLKMPASGAITETFDECGAVVLTTEKGAPVCAAARGTVIGTGVDKTHGAYVMLDHDGGMRTIYMGLGSISALMGDKVAAGRSIGTSGGQIRFMLEKDGALCDPLEYTGSAG